MRATTADDTTHPATDFPISLIERIRLSLMRLRNRAMRRTPKHNCEVCHMPLETPHEIAAGLHMGENEKDCHLTYAMLHSM